jgi:hypothetical protein
MESILPHREQVWSVSVPWLISFTNGMRWLGLAAQKGQHQAQALLGQMLLDGDRLPRQRALGLMWLTVACPDHMDELRKLLMPDKPDIPKHMDDIPQRWSDLPAGISESPRD